VAVVFRNNEQGQAYGITFIDHIHKTVFNGSSLGKAYSAKVILSQLGKQESLQKTLHPLQMSIQNRQTISETKDKNLHWKETNLFRESHPKLLEALLNGAQEDSGWVPKKKRKKKRTLKI